MSNNHRGCMESQNLNINLNVTEITTVLLGRFLVDRRKLSIHYH